MAEEGEMPPPEDVRVALEAEPTEPAGEEIPSWSGEMGDEEELGVPLQPEEVETPVTEVEGYGTEQEDVPSWLRELRAQAEKGETEPLLEKAEEAADEVELAPLEEEELPSWLRELKAEAAKEDIAPAPTPEEEITEEVFVEEVLVSEEQEQLVAEEVVPPAVTEEERVAPVAFTEAQEEAPPTDEERPAEARPEPGWGVAEYREYLQRSPRDHEARLTLARVYAESGDLEHAVKHYGELLSYASMTEEVLKDLEAAATSAPDHLATHELLADAYMRAGELKKALDKYRWLRAMITQ
jgi:tetratricopeptide (TPR) repeat protein